MDWYADGQKSMLKRLFSLFGRRRRQDFWWVGEAWEHEFPIVVRACSKIPEIAGADMYVFRIDVLWRFQSDSSGMPSDTEIESMNSFEDLLDEAVQAHGVAIQVVARTGNGKRLWKYYARGVEEFMEVLNRTLLGKPVYPIELNFEKDPDWGEFRRVLAGAK